MLRRLQFSSKIFENSSRVGESKTTDTWTDPDVTSRSGVDGRSFRVALPSLLRSAADRLSHILDRNTLNDEEYQ